MLYEELNGISIIASINANGVMKTVRGNVKEWFEDGVTIDFEHEVKQQRFIVRFCKLDNETVNGLGFKCSKENQPLDLETEVKVLREIHVDDDRHWQLRVQYLTNFRVLSR